jgi:ATP-dependent protease ClpP protease subunit
MVRPLPGGNNWAAALLGQHGIMPGKLIRVEPRGTPNGIFPHRTEDTSIDQTSIEPLNGIFSDWLGASAPQVAADLSTGFDGNLKCNKEWNGVKQGNYILDSLASRRGMLPCRTQHQVGGFGIVNEVKAEYRLTFGVNINIETANNLRSRIATILERGDFGSLTILFSSEGGSTDHSLELFNFISQLPIAIHMHGMGHIGSSAVPVFLAGTRRTCSPFGRFFFHQYDWGFAERQTLHRIDEAVKRLRSDINMARQIIQSRTDIPKDVLDSLEGGTAPTIIEPARAKVLRIIDDVCELPKTGNDGMKVAIWNA